MEALPTTAPEEKQPATEPNRGYKQGYIAPPIWLIAFGGFVCPDLVLLPLPSQGPVHPLFSPTPQGTQPHTRTCP